MNRCPLKVLLCGLVFGHCVRAEPIALLAQAEPWASVASDDVMVATAPTATGGIAIAWDYHAHAGYAGAARAAPIDWPEDFELNIPLKGDLNGNVLELKFADAANENVWWVRQVKLAIPAAGTVLKIRRREILFAWGPSLQHALTQTARLELVVTAQSGAPGAIEVGPLTLTPKAPAPAQPPPVTVLQGAQRVLLSALSTVPLPVTAPLVIDWGFVQESGGARVQWQAAGPHHYTLEHSVDGLEYTPMADITGAGRVDWVDFPATDAQYWRLRPAADTPDLGRLVALAPQPGAFGEDPNHRIAAIARERPRGEYPRGWLEQTAWTVLGMPEGGVDTDLLSEDGAFELGVGGPSLESFLTIDGVRENWANATSHVALEGEDLPMPSVTRQHGPIALTATAFATARGAAKNSILIYRLENYDDVTHVVDLDLAVRPLQVNPPTQFLNVAGGYTPIRAIAWEAARLMVMTPTQTLALTPSHPPEAISLGAFDGSLPSGLPTRWRVPAPLVGHAVGADLETGALRFHRVLRAHGRVEMALCVDRLAQDNAVVWRPTRCTNTQVGQHYRSITAGWRTRLHKVTVDGEGGLAHDVRDAIRSAHAHLLVSADGPWLRPGTRAYARSWIRDGAMMSAALLRLGETTAPIAYLDAWAGIQYASGKVPCCHDGRGADPVPENDSTGEFLYLAAQVLQYAGPEGRRHVEMAYPQLQRAVAYMDAQRAETLAQGAASDYAGLLPKSISHEGYSGQPMHSYWDNFWGLRGYSDAVMIATTLGHREDAQSFAQARAVFSAAVQRSLVRSMAVHGNAYLPGAADLGDFDPTSTTIALSPGTGGEDVPPQALRETFERYWTFFTARRDGQQRWDAYTPYEWRNVGALVRLGQRDRAFEAFRWFFNARRPHAWNQWPEVVTQDARAPRFIGDLPHGWVASDFLRAALDLYAYDDMRMGRLVLGAGLPRAWLLGRGVTVNALVTPWGRLSYRARRVGTALVITFKQMPAAPGGVVLDFPGLRADAVARVDGRRVATVSGRLTLLQPANKIVIAGD